MHEADLGRTRIGSLPLSGPRQNVSRVTVRLLAACVLFTGFCLATWAFDRDSIGVAADAYRGAGSVASNAAPALVLLIGLFALTRRLLSTVLLCTLLQWLIYAISSEKLAILEAPVGREDLHFLRGIDAGSISLFWPYIAEGRGWLPWAAAGVLVVLAVLLRLEKPWLRSRGPARLGLLALAVGGAVSLWLGAWPWSQAYSSERMPPPAFTPIDTVLRWGTMSHVVRAHVEARSRSFEVDAVALQQLRASVTPVPFTPSPGDPPDVVVVLSESFFDLQLLDRTGAIDATPATRRWLEAGHGGAMQAPTYGGGTVFTEFEVLTGLPTSAFHGIGSPYAELPVEQVPSLPRLLARAGYRSFALHGNSGGFYSRTSAFRRMGFDEFLTVSDFPAKGAIDGLWPSDRAMTDLLLDRLGTEGPPAFALAISMENHGPHSVAAPPVDQAAWDAIEVPEGLSTEAGHELRKLAYHLRNADAQLARLLEALQRRERPFVLLFFGDHLPNLRSAYPELGFADGRDASLQPVPWLLLSGHGEILEPVPRPVGRPWQLAAELMREAGIRDPYFETVRALGDASPAATLETQAGLVALARARLTEGATGGTP